MAGTPALSACPSAERDSARDRALALARTRGVAAVRQTAPPLPQPPGEVVDAVAVL